MTFEKVSKLFADELGIDEADIKMESDIIADLQADSFDIFVLLNAFTKEFGVEIPNEDVPTLKTIGDIVNYIDARK